MVLPAARETIDTWVHGFGFGFMEFDQESTMRRELRVLVFPGTRLLCHNTAAVRVVATLITCHLFGPLYDIL